MKNDFKKDLIRGGVDYSFTGSVRGFVSRVILNAIPDLIGYRSRINKTIIIGRVKRTDNLSLIKKEAAGILGSCVASPRMTVEKGYCHLEPRAIARGCKDLINKCRDCIELTRLKQVRIKLKRDLYGDFACAQPLKMTMIICFALCLGIISEARAGCDGCIACCGSSCCFPGCSPEYVMQDNNGVFTCKRCGSNEVIVNGVCVALPTCVGGTVCRNAENQFIANCCYKTEGDTTTLYPDNPGSVADMGSVELQPNKNLIIEEGFTNSLSSDISSFENVYLPDGFSTSHCWGCNYSFNLKNLFIPDEDTSIQGSSDGGFTGYNIVCLGDIDKCKTNVGPVYADKVVPPTEEQCNGAGSYYFTGSGCAKRPTNGTDITCDHEYSGYVKVGNYCASPEDTYAKKRYTPAEAAQWLNEDNNTVTLTFKK